MFLSNSLICLVFANDYDTYYSGDLLKLDLNQSLWLRLHSRFDAVYFLSAQGSRFDVRSFGDLSCGKCVLKWSLFATEQQQQGKWLLEQLCGKSGKAAFVCSVEDFCAVLEDEAWYDVLDAMAREKKRTGCFVLTASATAERSTRLLLESPVFERLQERSITDLRSGSLRNLYESLKNRKGDECVFLNRHSRERLEALLLHLMVQNPQWVDWTIPRSTLAAYLHDWLASPEAVGGGLFPLELPPYYLRFDELFRRLSDRQTWKTLESESLRYAAVKHRPIPEVQAPVLRARDSYAYRCLGLRLPHWLSDGDGVRDLLGSIQSTVASPKNRLEDPDIGREAAMLLDRVSQVLQGDEATFVLLLQALEFCVRHVCDQAAGQVPDILSQYHSALDVSEQCFLHRQDLERNIRLMPAGPLRDHALTQSRAELAVLEKLGKTYADLIRARILSLKMPGIAQNVTELQKELEQQLDDMLEPHGEPSAQEPPEPQELPLPEDLTSLYDWKPPV